MSPRVPTKGSFPSYQPLYHLSHPCAFPASLEDLNDVLSLQLMFGFYQNVAHILAAALHLLNCDLLLQEQQNSCVATSDMLHMREAFFGCKDTKKRHEKIELSAP